MGPTLSRVGTDNEVARLSRPPQLPCIPLWDQAPTIKLPLPPHCMNLLALAKSPAFQGAFPGPRMGAT